MDAVPIANYLERKSRVSAGISGNPTAADIQAAAEAWYQKGLRDGIEQAKAGCEAAMTKKDEDCERNIVAARGDWARTEGALLAQKFSEAVSALEASIADTVARILRPFVAQSLVDEALTKLVSELEKLLSNDSAIILQVTGPDDLVSELQKRLRPKAAITVQSVDETDITVTANKTVIETRLTEWLARIELQSHVKQQSE